MNYRDILRGAAAPVAAAVFPVLSLFSSNLWYLVWGDVLPALTACAVFGLAAYLLFLAFFRSAPKGAIAATAVVVLVFSFDFFMGVHVQPGTADALVPEVGPHPNGAGAPDLTRVVVYLALLVGFLILLLALRRGRNFSTAATVIAVFAASICAVPLLQVLWNSAERLSRSQSAGADSAVAESAQSGAGPDIYYIVLDGYSRFDVIERVFRADMRPFRDALAQRGFVVADRARTNYLQTYLSLSSTLNLDYLPPSSAVRADEYREQLAVTIKNSTVSRYLKGRGYRYVSIASGYPATSPNPYASLDIDSDVYSVSDFDVTILGLTPLAVYFESSDAVQKRAQRRVLFAFETLKSFQPASQPTFVFAHVVSPHPPFLFGPDGTDPAIGVPLNLNDGDHFNGTFSQYRTGYAGQVRFVNDQLLAIVDQILAKYPDGAKPVILFQGDHGSGAMYHHDIADRGILWERSSIFYAYYVPPGVAFDPGPAVTPVNTFRLLFNGLFGERYERLPDKTYFAPWTRPYDQTELKESQMAPPPRL